MSRRRWALGCHPLLGDIDGQFEFLDDGSWDFDLEESIFFHQGGDVSLYLPFLSLKESCAAVCISISL